MKNNIRTFTLYVKDDEKSRQIADQIRSLNQCSATPLKESDNGDLIIAVGGDGAFLHAVNGTHFDSSKIYAGIHTGTLGFLQNLAPNEIFSLIKYLCYEQDIKTRKIYVPSILITLTSGETILRHALNEVLIAGKNYTKISFAEYVEGEFFQRVSGNGIIIATSTGDTAYSMNAGGAIDFTKHFQLVCTLETPIRNAVNERFITNPVICSDVGIEPIPSDNVDIIIDGIIQEVDSSKIARIDVRMSEDSNYINKFELQEYSKSRIIREKILGIQE